MPFDFRDPSQAAPAVEVRNPLWVRGLSGDAATPCSPEAALAAGYRQGVGVVDCSVAHDGGLTDCAVASEQPAGVGIGQAALTMAESLAMIPWTARERPGRGRPHPPADPARRAVGALTDQRQEPHCQVAIATDRPIIPPTQKEPGMRAVLAALVLGALAAGGAHATDNAIPAQAQALDIPPRDSAVGDDELLSQVASDRAYLAQQSREQNPSGWARAQVRPSASLFATGMRGDDAALRDAVAAARSALEVWTRDSEPQEWSALQLNLGTLAGQVLAGAIRRPGGTLSRRSVCRSRFLPLPGVAGHYRVAIKQGELADALFLLGSRGDSGAQSDAIAAYRAACWRAA